MNVMEITGIDYYFETSYSLIEFRAYFNEKIKDIWSDYYECDCSEENCFDYFYAKDKSMFDLMDERGYYLTKDGEGPFLLMLGKNGVTLVLPDTIESSPFCRQIFDIVAYKLKVPTQKKLLKVWKDGYMKEKYFKIIVILLFAFLTAVEIGIFFELLWHGWGGFGDISMEYTEKGALGSACLIGFIPVSVLVLFMMYVVINLKKKLDKKQFFSNCIWPMLGITIAIGGFFLVPQAPFYKLGRWIAALFIDFFNWMKYPVP